MERPVLVARQPPSPSSPAARRPRRAFGRHRCAPLPVEPSLQAEGAQAGPAPGSLPAKAGSSWPRLGTRRCAAAPEGLVRGFQSRGPRGRPSPGSIRDAAALSCRSTAQGRGVSGRVRASRAGQKRSVRAPLTARRAVDVQRPVGPGEPSGGQRRARGRFETRGPQRVVRVHPRIQPAPSDSLRSTAEDGTSTLSTEGQSALEAR
jgi:hypothetical protein